MSKCKGSPRKFSEKIALLNKKEAETTAEFKKIITGVERIIRAPSVTGAGNIYYDQHPCSWADSERDEFLSAALPSKSSSFSNWQTTRAQQRDYMANQPTTQQQQQPCGHNDQNMQHMERHAAFMGQTNHAQQTSQYEPQSQIQPQRLHQHAAATIEGSSNACFGVPTIEIFPIDDEYDTTPIMMAPTTQHNGKYINEDYPNEYSIPLSISSSHSMPNIAAFGAPSTSPYGLAGRHIQRVVSPVNQELMLIGNNFDNMIVTSRSNGNIIASQIDYLDGQQQDYRFLPPAVQQIHQTFSGHLNRNDPVGSINTDIQQNAPVHESPCMR